MAVLIEEVHLADLSRRRPITFKKLDATVAHNVVGSFVLDMPATPRNWDLIQLDSNGDLLPVGLAVDWNGVHQIALLAEDWTYASELGDSGRVEETLTLIGADFLSLLANRIAYPAPAAGWASQTTSSTTYGPSPAETVIKDLVTANLKTAGDTLRRVPLLTVDPDLGRGGTATYKVVPPDPAATTGTQTATIAQSLMDAVRAVALQTPIGGRITLGSAALHFDTYLPRDLSEAAVFSPTLGNLPQSSLSVTAPTGNAVLLQSKVTGANFTTAAGNGYNNPWRRIEQYSDQTSTDTAADVATAGAEALAQGAGQAKIALTAMDLPRLRFGADDPSNGIQGYLPGDIGTADIRDGVSYADVISKVQLVADATGDEYTETVTPTIGLGDDQASDATISSKLSAKVRRLERDLRRSI